MDDDAQEAPESKYMTVYTYIGEDTHKCCVFKK